MLTKKNVKLRSFNIKPRSNTNWSRHIFHKINVEKKRHTKRTKLFILKKQHKNVIHFVIHAGRPINYAERFINSAYNTYADTNLDISSITADRLINSTDRLL